LRVLPALALALAAACGPSAPPAETAPATTAEPAPPAEASAATGTDIAAELTDCAGAIAAAGSLDPLADPTTGTDLESAYFVVLALMDKEPGLAGPEARNAAAAARNIWLAKPASERDARVASCRERFRA
jgi:hypothetical protein